MTPVEHSGPYPQLLCKVCGMLYEIRTDVPLEFPCRGPRRPDAQQLAEPLKDSRAIYAAGVRERWTEELHRPLDQVLESIDLLAAAGLLPVCGCPDTVQAVLTDLLTPGRWRKAWGEQP